MKKTKKLTLSAVLCALAVVLLYLGRLIEVLDLSAAVLASFFVIFLFMEAGLPWALMHYFATAVLALAFGQGSGAPVFYLAFGLYPIGKAYLERLPRVAEWILKMVTYNAVFFLLLFFAKQLLLLPSDFTQAWFWVVFALGNVVFVLYDIALSRAIVFYCRRLRHRFSHLLH